MTAHQHPTPPAGPSADVSVRVGWTDDAAGIAGVQVRAWRHDLADVLPADVLRELDADQLEAAWTASLATPRDARNRVLVALERPIAVGEVSELLVDPANTRQGHGSRLVQACVDTLRADRFGTAVLWLNTQDDVRRTFLTSAGWAADGAHRELDLYGDGSVLVKQVRLHTDLAEPHLS
jgi:GNAT superfamily N-acetyltransferase